MDGPGAPTIEHNASILEKIFADIEAEELLSIEAELIEANWDPYRVAERNLIFLAFNLGVQLWDDNWSVETKRSWLAIQWEFKSLIGTETAIRIALGLWGYTLEDIVTPPQGFFAGQDLTEQQRNEWIERMPSIRIRTVQATGFGHPEDWFAGDGFAGVCFAEPNDGPSLYGRRGYLRRDGEEIPLQSEIITVTETNQVITEVERIAVPGRSTLGFFAGEDFAGDERYAGAAEVEAEFVTVSKSTEAISQSVQIGLSQITPGLKPLDVNWKRISDVGNGGDYFYAGDYADDAFAGKDDAGDLLNDVLYLLDPTIAAPMTEGFSFAGVDRVGIEPKTAELLIDLKTSAGPFEWYAGVSFVGEGCAVNEDDTERDNALRAVAVATALRDTVLVSFAAKRPLGFRDTIRQDTKINTWVSNML